MTACLIILELYADKWQSDELFFIPYLKIFILLHGCFHFIWCFLQLLVKIFGFFLMVVHPENVRGNLYHRLGINTHLYLLRFYQFNIGSLKTGIKFKPTDVLWCIYFQIWVEFQYIPSKDLWGQMTVFGQNGSKNSSAFYCM